MLDAREWGQDDSLRWSSYQRLSLTPNQKLVCMRQCLVGECIHEMVDIMWKYHAGKDRLSNASSK